MDETVGYLLCDDTGECECVRAWMHARACVLGACASARMSYVVVVVLCAHVPAHEKKYS